MCTNPMITKDFLQHLFPQPIISFTCDTDAKSGDNYMSSIGNVKVILGDTDGGTLTKHIFVKFYPENEAKQRFLENTPLFETEYLSYRELIPILNGLAKEIRSSDCEEPVVVNAASFYGGNVTVKKDSVTEPWLSQKFIVLEDLRLKGYQPVDPQKGLDMEHSLLIIQQLANLHALSWVYKRRNHFNFWHEKYPYLIDKWNRKENEVGWRPVVEGLTKGALAVIREEFGDNSDVFLRLNALLSVDVMASLRLYVGEKGFDESDAEKLLREPPPPYTSDINEPWLVATHGDCWINNLLFSYNDSQKTKPNSVVIVDHQGFRESCLMSDLAYIVYSGIKTSQREQMMNKLLPVYYDRFVSICNSLNEKPPLGFTLENVLRRWRRTRVYGLLMSFVFIPFLYKQNPEKSSPGSVGEESSGSENEMKNAYSCVTDGLENNDLWKKEIIEVVKAEYNSGVL